MSIGQGHFHHVEAVSWVRVVMGHGGSHGHKLGHVRNCNQRYGHNRDLVDGHNCNQVDGHNCNRVGAHLDPTLPCNRCTRHTLNEIAERLAHDKKNPC